MSHRPIVWTIAGSDSGGGAGIQADLKTMNALGGHACSIITALTAQNTQGVFGIEPVSPEFVRQQLKALKADLPAVAIKLGMLANTEIITTLAQELASLNAFIVLDPVMISSSGHALLEPVAESALIEQLLPLATLITPNLAEVARLLDIEMEALQTDLAIEAAAGKLLGFGPKSVLIKGGHRQSAFSQDYWTNGTDAFWLTNPMRNSRNTHGTGCTLSSAIASALALGYSLPDALVIAKAYVNQGIRLAPGLRQGLDSFGPLAHLGWPDTEEDMPWVTSTAEAGRNRPSFPDCQSQDNKLGFYPVVPNADWLEKLFNLGVTTAQLRIKDLAGDALDQEIARAIKIGHRYDARLFINDYWQLALKHQAYGVHLGQEDLQTADTQALASAGIRLGISTHCYEEVSRALALRPSYMAIGPIHSTTTKVMRFAPQGIEALKHWRKLLDSYPLVAIGGLFLYNATEALDAGADSVAVVRDILLAENVPERVAEWQTLMGGYNAASGGTTRSISGQASRPSCKV